MRRAVAREDGVKAVSFGKRWNENGMAGLFDRGIGKIGRVLRISSIC